MATTEVRFITTKGQASVLEDHQLYIMACAICCLFLFS